MQKHHTRDKYFYCANSTKQFRLITALWDQSCLAEAGRSRLLQRSATILRATVQPAPSGNISGNRVDRHIRLLLDTPGPRFVNKEALGEGLQVRRLGVYHYTKAFAEVVLRSALLSGASIRETQSRAVSFVTSSGSELASLLPTWIVTWEKLLDDIFSSPQVRLIRGSMASNLSFTMDSSVL
jgi:hypothetical protein